MDFGQTPNTAIMEHYLNIFQEINMIKGNVKLMKRCVEVSPQKSVCENQDLSWNFGINLCNSRYVSADLSQRNTDNFISMGKKRR